MCTYEGHDLVSGRNMVTEGIWNASAVVDGGAYGAYRFAVGGLHRKSQTRDFSLRAVTTLREHSSSIADWAGVAFYLTLE